MLGFLIIVCLFAQCSGLPDCVIDDSVCWTNFFNNFASKMANGLPELGSERLDPLEIDVMEIKKNDIFFKSTNNIFLGLKEPIVVNISNHKDLKVMVLVFRANVTITGDYTMNGSMFSIPMTGNGKIKIVKKNCHFEMIMPYDIIKDANGQDRINLKYVVFSGHAYGGTTYNLENLLPGQNGKNEKIHALLNQHWRIVEAHMGVEFTNKIMINKIFEAMRIVIAAYEIKL